MQTQLEEIAGWKRFTNNAKEAVVQAHELAAKYRNPQVEPIHVFYTLINQPTQLISRIIEKVGLDVEFTKIQLLSEIERKRKSDSVAPVFSAGLKEVINKSFLMSERLDHVYVGSEHLLLALLEMEEEDFVRELRQLGLSPSRLEELAVSLGTYPQGILAQQVSAEERLFGDDESSLPFFCRDMNEQASKGEFLNITGRDKEIDRLIHILARKTKNNPILVGDAGVGKTAIVEGLAQRIVKGNVPPSFIDKQVLSLDVAAIVAGARVRGDIEERVLALVNEAIEDGDKIIFIDEIHMIVGAGGYGGRDSMDIGNILKPYLTNSNLRVIGATTVAEFRRAFDDDPALSRRFQPIDVEEIDRDSAIVILNNLKKDFEKYHNVKISEDAINEAVDLSSKFITDRFLPDKAIDLLDEAAASVKIGREIQIEPQLSDLGSKLLEAQRKKEEAMRNDNLEAAAKQREKEDMITDQISQLVEGHNTPGAKHKAVNADLVRNIVVNWTKIPLAAAKFDNAKLRNLRANIRARIAGQEHVVDSVVAGIRRSHLGLADPDKPLASFMFLGPTGVGKTELAKTIAQQVFGSGNLLTQINMSEYMEMHSVAKLIGSPPGYVGYQEGGQLTEQIRRRPYSVVLFDEIEKAHPEVLNILLQVLEEGELTDGRGRKANFRNTIVILTSNIGAEEVARDNKLGFDVSVESIHKNELDQAYTEMKTSLMNSLKDRIRPELLNRLDEIAVFRGLNEQDCLEITQILVDELAVRLLQNKIMLDISPAVVKMINKDGYSKEYGARNIRRAIQEKLETTLAEFLLESKLSIPKKGILKLNARTKNDKIVFSKA